MNDGDNDKKMALRRGKAAKTLGISERKLDQLVAQGAIPHFRCGRAVLFPVDRLHEWIAARTVGVADAAKQSP